MDLRVCRLSTASSLCIDLKHLLKVPYIILGEPNVAWFLIFETVFLGRAKTLTYVWKIHHRNERHLCLVTQSITKLSQNKCLVNTHILIYRHTRCDCKLWHALWFYCVFGHFHTLLFNIHLWIVVSPPNFHWLYI